MHYAAKIGTLVFEIYPLANNQTEIDKTLRLGFATDNFEETLRLLQQHKVVYSAPTLTEFGYMTIISDPDGRKVELYKK